MKIFVCAIGALKHNNPYNLQFSGIPSLIITEDEEMAKHQADLNAVEKFPISQGWTEHQISLLEVPEVMTFSDGRRYRISIELDEEDEGEQPHPPRKKMDPIYEYAAKQLAEMIQPSFNRYTNDDILKAFSVAVIFSEEWLTAFKAAIKDYSGGQTELTESLYNTGFRVPNKTCILKRGETEKRLVIVNHAYPLLFLQEETKKEQ
jgi:hypothetical protein